MSAISKGSRLTPSAIRKLRNKAKHDERARVEAMNKANADVVEARKGKDTTSKLVASVMRGAKADNRLSSTAQRDRLKGGTTTAGFQGPRGFATPKGAVTPQENKPGRLVGRDPGRPTAGANKSKPFALDTSWAGETLGYDYSVPKGEGEGSVMRLSAPFKPKGAKKPRRQWMTVDLNESRRKPFDEKAERMTDGNEYKARQRALRLK